MSLKTVAAWSALVPFLAQSAGSAGVRPAPAEVRLTLTTIHAAALTTPRAADDTKDAPYLLISVLGPKASTTTVQLPATGHLAIQNDEALGARPLMDLSLEPGDSVRLLVSLLEGSEVQPSEEAQAAKASTSLLAQSPAAGAAELSPALAPVTGRGAYWIGSATLLLTNEGGSTYWRALECLATCKVLKAPAGAALAPDAPDAGVVELSGSGGIYHLQMQGRRAK